MGRVEASGSIEARIDPRTRFVILVAYVEEARMLGLRYRFAHPSRSRTGVTLRQSDFDVSAWVSAWESIGGAIYWYADSQEWAFVYPPQVRECAETAEAVRELINEKCSHSAVIHHWLEGRASDPRFART